MFNATLVRRRELGDDLCNLWVHPDAGVPEFSPGQFIKLGLPERDEHGQPTEALVKRAYSIASAPSEHEGLELYVIKVRDGQLTPQVWELPEGARLWADKKVQGDFTLHDVPDGMDLVFVATGTGIAPYVSMLRTHAGTGRWRRVTVIHGARLERDLGYREELEGFARRHPEIRYVPILSRAPEGDSWTGQRGRVLKLLDPGAYAALAGAPLDPTTTHVFLCGNPDMVQSVRELLEPLGFVASLKRKPGTLHTERYW